MAYSQPPVSIADAYQILGVQHGESLEAVKSAYRRLALLTHPDKNPGNEAATQQFQQISEAYHVLGAHFDNPSQKYPHPPGEFNGGNGGGTPIFVDGLQFYLWLHKQMFDGCRMAFDINPFFLHHNFNDHRDHRSHTPKSHRPQGSNGESLFKPDYSRGSASSPWETSEQAAARLAQETARARERMKQQRENETKDAATRQKEKAERKRETARQDRQTAAEALASQQGKVQALRSKVFAAARNGDADAVKSGVWEQAVDSSGGEIKHGCDNFVCQKPADPHETLLHIAARHGNKDLLEWLGSHGGNMEERTSEDHTAFHIALKHGHIPVLKYFFETYPANDEDTKEVYFLPGPSSLLALAVESRVPEAVWMILDNKLFQRVEIFDVWKNLSSPSGMAAFTDGIKQTDIKSPAQKEEILHEVINLIMRFGGFTRPPTPANSPDPISPRESPASSSSGSRPGQGVPSSHRTQPRGGKHAEQLNQRKPRRNASDQSAPEARSETSQNTCGGRGRGRGRGRGHTGHSRGRPQSSRV